MSRKQKIILVAGITALIVLSASWYGISHYYLFNTTLPAPLTSGIAYRDPDNYFTITIPNGWHVSRDVSESTSSSGQEQYHLKAISTTFMPNNPPSADDPSVYIYLESVHDAGSKHWACVAHPIQPNTTVAGLAAHQNDPAEWEVNAQNAHFQIDFSIAKGYFGGPFSVVPTPLPAAEVKSRTDLLTSIIATFRPVPDQPLVCS